MPGVEITELSKAVVMGCSENLIESQPVVSIVVEVPVPPLFRKL